MVSGRRSRHAGTASWSVLCNKLVWAFGNYFNLQFIYYWVHLSWTKNSKLHFFRRWTRSLHFFSKTDSKISKYTGKNRRFDQFVLDWTNHRSITSFKTPKWPQTKWYTKKTPFSGTVFNTLSHGVVHFVASGSSENHLLTSWDFLTANQMLLFNGLWSYHSQQN